ncbi:MAG: hypothetical protein IPJ19_00085 [Planctomycetes bacterium]|nr:hypothetical protein [Planctomycetota bacterium]
MNNHVGKQLMTSKSAGPVDANELTAEQQAKLDPQGQAAQKLARKKLAATLQSQSMPQSMLQGSQQANPRAFPPTLTLGGSDDCSTADLITGVGSFAFDTTLATTSPQQGLSCGQGSAFNDVWFDWTAPSSGICNWTLCGLAGIDTLVAAYSGSGCPVGGAIACDDDSSCGLESTLLFSVVGGQHYMLQLGSYSGATGAGSFTLSVLTPPANDNCATPVNVVGAGPFNFDNTVASTGTQGQSEALCAVEYGNTTVDNDVWYTWTAPSTGLAAFTTCSLTSTDTKIAAYAGSGCPAPGSALACRDDACQAFQSTALFPCTAGSTYTLQIGTFPGAVGGAGQFSINVVQPPVNDNCTAPTVVSGSGTFPFDNTYATTSTSGQSEALCAVQYGNPTVENDVWFRWTAPTTGIGVFDTCGLTTVDTKIAVYAGTACPTAGSALGCLDDSCGVQTTLIVPVTAGSSYMIQLGTFPGASGGVGSIALSVVQPPPNDDCSTPTVISGTGTFPFSNLVASTGTQGQTEALCLSFGSTTIDHDVWYRWTAPATACTILDTCGNTVDTKIAVYNTSSCPAAGTAVACNDDSCGLQSAVRFTATAGQTYLVQLGCFPGAAGGSGSFNITQLTGGVGNDSCSSATVISGLGVFPFDNSAATTGCEGQNESLCAAEYGNPVVENDVWFRWVAPSAGFAILDACGLTSIDTKIGVYGGAGCPTAGSAIACNDDACPGFQSTAVFAATAGATYTIQMGTFPGALGGPGSFSVSMFPPCTPYDDGSTENLLGWTAGGDMVWLMRFGTPGASNTIGSIDVAWGSAAFPGFNPGNGTATDIFIYADGASQDGDPTDATLLLTIPTTVSNVDTDTYVHYPIAPLNITGVYFVGSHQAHNAGQFVAPMDQTTGTWSSFAWFFGDNSSPVANYANPGANIQPPLTFGEIGFPCQLLVRANCSTGPATYLCDPASAGAISCPCANPPSGSGRGCNNSASTGGASITGAGNNSLATPTVAFTTAGERPTSPSILLQGNSSNATGVVFGQGVRCVTGVLKRLYTKTAVGGSITAPNLGGGDPSIPARSAALGDVIGAGTTRWYAVYYRDPIVLGGCVATSTYNITNTAQVVWQP